MYGTRHLGELVASVKLPECHDGALQAQVLLHRYGVTHRHQRKQPRRHARRAGHEQRQSAPQLYLPVLMVCYV